MKRKVGTVMDEALFRRAKLEAARQGRPMASILDEALTRYLDEGGPRRGGQHRGVADSWGAMALPPDVVRAVMEDEDEYGVS